MFKKFTEEQQNVYDFVSNKTYNFNQSQLTRYQFLSASSHPTASRYHHFARINFYLSGSSYSKSDKKYNSYPIPGNGLNQQDMFLINFMIAVQLYFYLNLILEIK